MKKFLTVLPALAIALLLTACSGPAQPAIPGNSPSLEKALKAKINEEKAITTEEEVMEGDELSEEDMTVELDEALDSLGNELDEALNEDAGAEATEEDTATAAEAEVAPAPAPVPTAGDAGAIDTAGQIDNGQNDEEELLDQPIIIE